MTNHSKQRREQEERSRRHAELVERLAEVSERWEGQRVELVECLSRHAPSQDRHHATTTRFAMTVEKVGWLFSGAQLVLWGDAQEQYGIAMDCVTAWEREQDNTIEITEQFTPKLARFTTVSLV